MTNCSGGQCGRRSCSRGDAVHAKVEFFKKSHELIVRQYHPVLRLDFSRGSFCEGIKAQALQVNAETLRPRMRRFSNQAALASRQSTLTTIVKVQMHWRHVTRLTINDEIFRGIAMKANRAVLVVVLALMMAGPVAVKKANSETGCIKGKVLTAFQTRMLQTELVVGALSCKLTPRYAEFVNAYKSELLEAHKTLSKYFGDDAKLEAYKSMTATQVSQRSLSNIVAACAEWSAIYDQILAPERVKFVSFLKAEPLAHGHGQNVCGKPTTVIAANRPPPSSTASGSWSQPPVTDPDGLTCINLGFSAGTPAIADCRLRLMEIRQREADRSAVIAEQERQNSLRQLQLGLCLMNGKCDPTRRPPSRSDDDDPRTYHMTLPNGNHVNCVVAGPSINCR